MLNDYRKQISELQKQIGKLFEEKADYDEICELSVKLDEIINLYMDEQQKLK